MPPMSRIGRGRLGQKRGHWLPGKRQGRPGPVWGPWRWGERNRLNGPGRWSHQDLLMEWQGPGPPQILRNPAVSHPSSRTAGPAEPESNRLPTCFHVPGTATSPHPPTKARTGCILATLIGGEKKLHEQRNPHARRKKGANWVSRPAGRGSASSEEAEEQRSKALLPRPRPLGQAQDQDGTGQRRGRVWARADHTEGCGGRARRRRGRPRTDEPGYSSRGAQGEQGPGRSFQSHPREARRGFLAPPPLGTATVGGQLRGHHPPGVLLVPRPPLGVGGGSLGQGEGPEARPRLTVTGEPGGARRGGACILEHPRGGRWGRGFTDGDGEER